MMFGIKVLHYITDLRKIHPENNLYTNITLLIEICFHLQLHFHLR